MLLYRALSLSNFSEILKIFFLLARFEVVKEIKCSEFVFSRDHMVCHLHKLKMDESLMQRDV